MFHLDRKKCIRLGIYTVCYEKSCPLGFSATIVIILACSDITV